MAAIIMIQATGDLLPSSLGIQLRLRLARAAGSNDEDVQKALLISTGRSNDGQHHVRTRRLVTMSNHGNPGQMAGDATTRGIDKQTGVLHTSGVLARKAAGAKKAPGVQPARGVTTRLGLDRPRAVVTKQLSLATGKDTYAARVVGETLRQRGSSSRPDGKVLPSGPDIYVISKEGHERRVAKGNLRPELQLYLLDKRMHFGNPTVFLGTQLDGEDVVLNLSVPCRGLLEALMLGHVNRQTAVYHPASNGFLQVPDSRELSGIAAACACAKRKTFPEALACVDASLSDLPQDVYVGVLNLILAIGSSPPADMTEESLAELQRICKRAGEVDGSYASWLAVAIAHAVHRLNAASSEVPSSQEMLQAAV